MVLLSSSCFLVSFPDCLLHLLHTDHCNSHKDCCSIPVEMAVPGICQQRKIHPFLDFIFLLIL